MVQATLAAHKPLVLLVAGTATNRELLKDALAACGCAVVLAADVHGALTACTERLPDLALIELELSDADGCELCRRLRTLEDGELRPVVVFGEKDDLATQDRVFAAGADDYISQPFQAERLMQRLKWHLRHAAAAREVSARREELQLMREALDCLPIGITIADRAGRIRYANPAEAQMHGYTPSELAGRLAAELGESDIQPRPQSEDLSHRGPWRRDTINRRKDGRTFPVRLHSAMVRDGQGEIIGTVTVCEDLAELRRMERALRRRDEELHLLFDKSPDGLCFMMLDEPVSWGEECDQEAVIDYVLAHQRLTRVNRALLEQYGASEREFVGTPFGHFFAHDPEQGRRTVRTLLEQGQALIETEERRCDGTPMWIEGYYVCLYDEHGRVIGKFGAQREVTVRKVAERQLREAKRQAEAAARTKGEFLANMSHEIRTPLNGMLGMLQLLQTTSLDAEQQDYVTTAIYSGNSLLAVINDILEFSKLEAGKIQPAQVDFELGQLLDNCLSIFTQQAVSKGLLLDWVVTPKGPCWLCGDPGRLRQILFNLIGNAVKFTEQGRVLVSGKVERDAEKTRGVILSLAVSDTGSGIPEQALASIFEPFTQADGSHTRRYQGTGLGLSIVRKLVEYLGGTVAINSTLGGGTTVSITLPLTLPSLSKSAEVVVAAVEAESVAPMTLLLVEDNEVNRRLLQRQLEKIGHQVISVGCGQDALELLESMAPDAVLLDIQMPGMDGLEVTRKIREQGGAASSRELPVIAITAHALPGDRERFLAAGMTGYLAKPIRIEELHQVLSGCRAAGKALDSGGANV